MNKELLKDAMMLMLITVVAGCLLGIVHMVTEKPIAVQEEKTKQEAYKEVFPDAVGFVDANEAKDVIKVDSVDPEKDMKDALAAADLDAYNSIDEILACTDSSDSVIGFVMTVTNKEAYGGSLTLTMGVKTDGTVTGIAFTDLSETAGLGMKADESEFKDQFKDKQFTSFKYTKSGASADDEIDALSGATITTNAVTNGVDAGLAYFQYITGGGSNE